MTERTSSKTVRAVIERLGYTEANGLVWAETFDTLGSHRAALATAAARMQVVAAFGLYPSQNRPRFKPLVLIAQADDDSAVLNLHRRVWSQGLVPYLIVVTPQSAWLCDGFGFSSDMREQKTRKRLDVDSLAGPTDTVFHKLHAHALRSRITWRDYAVSETGVDEVLLNNLGNLSDVLIKGQAGFSKLPIELAHALIGRMIYLYMLVDRGILNEAWFEHQKQDRRAVVEPYSPWPVETFLALNTTLDGVFNGTIFPLQTENTTLEAAHLTYLRDAIRLGRANSDGSLQLALFEIDLGSIRIETLSAVYELFLAKTNPKRKKADGAFYTPPFLADFILDSVEDRKLLTEHDRVLDPACGSGVFLVGAYRRKIENVLVAEQHSVLPASRLQTILTTGIFGAELEPQACHVAAFSLYLTLLDYLDGDEVMDFSLGKRGVSEKLFPPLVGTNLVPGDFFSPSTRFSDQFDIVVGNPPWGNALRSDAEWLKKAAQLWKDRVENAQAAQVFVLETLERSIAPGGIAAYLLPASSFGNDRAAPFRHAMTSYEIVSVTNLAPFRRELFKKAEQAAAILVMSNKIADDDHLVRFDAPTAISQPVKRRTAAWTLVLDPGESVGIPQAELATDTAWVRGINGRSVDRLIMNYVDGHITRGRFATLGSLTPELVVKLGAETRYSGVPKGHTLTTRSGARTDYTNFFGSSTALKLDDADDIYPLPKKLQKSIKDNYRSLFLNDVVLVPRKQGSSALATRPVAFNTTLIGIGLKEPKVAHGRTLLRAITLVLNSRWAQYYLTLHAPSAMMDRPRLSLVDLTSLPLPFRSLEDPRLERFLEQAPIDLDTACYDLLGITGEFRSAIEEFLDYRRLFANAKVPEAAFVDAEEAAHKTYVQTIRKRLIGVSGVGPEREFRDPVRNVTVVQTSLDPSLPSQSFDLEPALRSYDQNAGAAFEDSLFFWRDPDAARLVLVKPPEAHHWTIAQAFIDADRVAAGILAPHT
ncbi:hypothetical protein ASF53_11640 [Methylobacterium sp. Leaf123]|uniref:HsdM family class I SAM-dependent methyltransferase n=1 Tax=Methylobacterium sp. Leaf123 TaxID=1736264 RepID=UPI0007020E5E|nr:N-6 DNA methylase [Methylobacterium sp. Leaf123]KQQ13618.1 hypothetical protein ASF53_11640 [Methylobacterium sp. Leaf123]